MKIKYNWAKGIICIIYLSLICTFLACLMSWYKCCILFSIFVLISICHAYYSCNFYMYLENHLSNWDGVRFFKK